MKKTLFLVFSGAIVIFSIISICSAPIINKVLTESNDWGTLNCKKNQMNISMQKIPVLYLMMKKRNIKGE